MRDKVRIRLALDSVLYAPLYVAVQLHSRSRGGQFRFLLEPVREPPTSIAHQWLDAFRFSDYDPVFSPVVSPAHRGFDGGSYATDWFAVGDPIRLGRLQAGGQGTAYAVTAWLVRRLGFWIGARREVELNQEDWNYVTCHPRGMTGYIFAEYLLAGDSSRPIAPVREPGEEVRQFVRALRMDRRRVRGWGDPYEDPVKIGTITTEIGELVLHGRPGSKRSLARVCSLQDFCSDLAQTYAMTIIARREGTGKVGARIDEAERELQGALDEAIRLLSEDRERFEQALREFYLTHARFRIPGSSRLFLGPAVRKMFTTLVNQLQGHYGSPVAVAPATLRSDTMDTLRKAIATDIRVKKRAGEAEISDKVESALEMLNLSEILAT